MSFLPRRILLLCLALVVTWIGLLPAQPATEQIVLVEKGKANCVIVVPARVLDAKAGTKSASWNSLDPAVNLLRLRESVHDLAGILERMSGAKVEILADVQPEGDRRIPIRVGEIAGRSFGEPSKKFPFQQGFRLVAGDKGIGLCGESDLATSYAIYTLLDQLGCRWYMPGPLGEILPDTRTITVAKQDVSTGPYTVYRGLWYLDSDFARRNRLGGMVLHAGHALEQTVPKKLRETNPEIRAMVNGKPHAFRVKWTHPLVAKAIADVLLARLEKDPSIKSFSLSPDDGLGWDESDDTKYDAGDFDAAAGMVSKTDRLIVLANRVAEQVTAKYPDVKFGLLAYADYIRPPVREKVHAAIVPQIAPITFSRAHPMTDAGEPNNKGMRYLVEGWGKAVPATSYYFYGFNLAELSSPNPMITKWGTDIPIAYQKGNCRYWQPETLPNFESCLHAHTLGIRLAWDPTLSPREIIDELHQKFYGAASKPMADYWHFIDRTWAGVPEYSGCGFGHMRRWSAEVMKSARQHLERGKAAAQTPLEKKRVALADESLALFERFMQLRHDLADGRFVKIAEDANAYVETMEETARRYRSDYAFSFVPWGFRGKGGSINSIYFRAFYDETYQDAGRIAREFTLLTPAVRNWHWRQDADGKGKVADWAKVDLDDSAWKTTDVAVDTWSALGLHSYMGTLWYRQKVKLPAIPEGKKVYLWIGATDGSTEVFVNGKAIPFVGPKGAKQDTFTGYCKPVSFDITAAVRPGENQLSLRCTRTFLNELGTGGLLAPVVIYQEK